MKYVLCIASTFLVLACSGQTKKQIEFTHENFRNEILQYEPTRKEGVTAVDFRKGLFKLEETKLAVKNDPQNFTYADYWNIAMAFVNFGESSKNIQMAFEKAVELDPEKVCSIIQAFGGCQLDVRIPEVFYPFSENCTAFDSHENFNVAEYAQQHNLELPLVTLINQIRLTDTKYRFDKSPDMSKQKLLDKKNQTRIDSLFNETHTYIGKSLVGEKLQNTMWAVIQHSDVEMMERYLPVISKAVKNDELHLGPLKLLIDRYYGLKYGYQIFGTQSGFGFDLAEEAKRTEIRLKYEISE